MITLQVDDQIAKLWQIQNVISTISIFSLLYETGDSDHDK